MVNHELILGDNKREKNFESAIKNESYFIIIYSDNLFNSPCAIEEEKRIFAELNNIHNYFENISTFRKLDTFYFSLYYSFIVIDLCKHQIIN